MSSAAVAAASRRRLDTQLAREIELRCDLLLANYQHISPSAMGHLRFLLKHYAKNPHPFRACVTGDTLIDVPRDLERYPEGIPISQLRRGDLVWSFDGQDRCFKLKPVVWVEVTRRDAEILAIRIDNEKTIRCTSDHPFLLRDGRWIDAGDLRSGDSLMPLYRDFEPRLRLRPDRPGYTAEHDAVAEAVYEDLDGLSVHHVDRRRANVSIENIEALNGSDHSAAHHKQWDEAVALRNEQWRCESCDELFTPIAYNQKKCDHCKVGYVKQIVGKKSICAVCDDEYVVRAPNQRYCSKLCRHRAKDRGISHPGKIGGQPNLATWNHKVVSVERINERVDVWDMEIMDTHTFVVHGVVLHNCVRDNMKRFGPGRTEAICATLKDAIRQTTHWRGHPSIDTPANSPGVGIAEADAKLGEVTIVDAFEQEFGIEPPEEVWRIIEQLGESCDVYRVLIGLDEAPRLELAA